MFQLCTLRHRSRKDAVGSERCQAMRQCPRRDRTLDTKLRGSLSQLGQANNDCYDRIRVMQVSSAGSMVELGGVARG